MFETLDDLLAEFHRDGATEPEIQEAVVQVAYGSDRKKLRMAAFDWPITRESGNFHRTLKALILSITEPQPVKFNVEKTKEALSKFLDGEMMTDREWVALSWLTMIDRNRFLEPDNVEWAKSRADRIVNLAYFQELKYGVEKQFGGKPN